MKIKIEKLDSRRKQYIKNAINKDKKDLKFCVLGAGHGGLAMAGHLAIMGFNVNVYNRGKRRVRPLSHRMAIKLEGEIQGIGNIALASNNIKECLDGVDILMVSIPANGHKFMANTCAPYLKESLIQEGQEELWNFIILLNSKELRSFPLLQKLKHLSMLQGLSAPVMPRYFL